MDQTRLKQLKKNSNLFNDLEMVKKLKIIDICVKSKQSPDFDKKILMFN